MIKPKFVTLKQNTYFNLLQVVVSFNNYVKGTVKDHVLSNQGECCAIPCQTEGSQ